VFLEDVSARYGTRKNGEKIAGRTDFGVGDVFTIGDYRLTLQSDVAPEAKPPKKPNGASPPPKPGFSNQPTQVTRLDGIGGGTEIIAADPAKLVIVSSNFAGQDFPLARKEMVIGRGEECDIIIDHRSVSQKHAKVVREQGGEYKIVDLKSKNGVKVGGEEYRAVHLKRGDIVELGHVRFRFVEPGENYVFTPQPDDEFESSGSKRKGMVIGLVAVIALISALIAVTMFGGEPERSEPIATNTTPETGGPTEPPPEAVDTSALDAKIDKAENAYLEGQVEKALGALEFLREEKMSPEQVTRVDDLFSKARREKRIARHLQAGITHLDGSRWLDALSEFHEIPDDDELNVYRLLKDGGHVERAIVAASEEQLERAKSESAEFDSAREALVELAAMFPSHVAPPEALAELDAMKPAKRVAVARPKTDSPKKVEPTVDPGRARMQADCQERHPLHADDCRCIQEPG
jgi:pSer/pThr/pTyr-binding forkhead associated (FHA) protein